MRYPINQNILCKKYKFIWFRNAKVAGSSIKKFCADLLDIKVDLSNRESIHLMNFPSASIQEIESKYQTYSKFFFVRNPWDRLVSCYKNKVLKNSTFNEFPYVNGVHQSFVQYNKFEANMLFEDFIKSVCSISDEEAEPHFRSQYVNILDKKGELIPLFIGKFENLNSDFKTICNKIGLNHKHLPHLMKSNHKNYKTYYNDKLISLVKKRFKKDIELFNYDF